MKGEDTGIFRPGIEIERANLANLFRQTPEMVCILAGPDHRFEFVNNAHIRALGFDATGKTVREAQPESVEVHGILDDVYRTGKTAELVEIPVTLGDRLRYFNLTYAARRNGRNEIDGIMILGSEVTETVLSRRAQENQRKWLESILNRLPTPIVLIDPKTSLITFENSACDAIFGFPVIGTDTKGRHGRGKAYITQNGKPITPDEVASARVIRGERLRDVEYRFETPKGVFDLSVSGELFPAEFGQPETALVMFQDVTPLKRIESALRQSDEQLKLALAVSKVGFYDWDVVNDRNTFSDQMLLDWGIPASERTAPLSAAIERIHPEDRARVSREIDAAIRERVDFHSEYRVVHPDGKTVWAEVRGQVRYDDAGNPLRFFGTSIDITERRRTEEILRTSEEGLRRIADSLPQVVWTAGPDGILDYTNRQWTEYSGSSAPEKWVEAVHPEDVRRVLPIWGEAIATGKTYQTEFRLRRADGVYRWFLVRAVPMHGRAGEITQWLGTCTDIEEQKIAENALRAANLAAESANASKSAFLANMSHEIRTPLGAILGFVGLMKNPKATSKSLASYISVIERNSDHLLRIVDDILDLSKVEAGLMQIERIEFSLPEILADFSSLMGFRAREKGIEFDLRAISDIPSIVVSDPTRLRQILANIVGNAIKFTEKGSVTLDVGYGNGTLRFRVTDTGVGISKDQSENLFQPFTQADLSTTRKYGGTGLGLVLTRKLSEALGGEFNLVESVPGEGSVFEAVVRIELGRDAKMLSPAEVRFEGESSTEHREHELAGLRVLIVEDSPDNQTLFRLTLEEAGAEAVVVSDGEAGVAAALAGSYDVVLMDIQMPKMDGHTAVRKLRAAGYSRPVIALTAHAMKEERERCERSGFSDFLSKPIQGDALVEKLGEIRERKKSSGKETRNANHPVRVLFVEDDDDIRDSVTELLEIEGFAIESVSSAEAALGRIEKAGPPDMVLTDLKLPGMTGAEFVSRLLDRRDRSTFQVFVASGTDELGRKTREMGADGFVRKPFDSTQLVKFLRESARSE